jgi:hypothetical protein
VFLAGTTAGYCLTRFCLAGAIAEARGWIVIVWSAIFGVQAAITAVALLVIRISGWRLVGAPLAASQAKAAGLR